MHEFFNLTPTSLSTVLLWYVLAIGGGVGFVGQTIRLQAQGKAALTRAAQSGRQSKRRKAPVVTQPPVEPLHHAPYRGRLALALYLTAYLLLISFGLGLAAPSVQFSCARTAGQTVDCAVREYVWFVAPSRHAIINDVTDVQEYSSTSSSTTASSRPTGGSTTYVVLTNREGQTLTTQTMDAAEELRALLLDPAATQVIVWGRASWLGRAISLTMLLVALLVGSSWLQSGSRVVQSHATCFRIYCGLLIIIS
jgi:hypothetical protein